MKNYIIVNLIGAANNKVTLFLETNNHFDINELVAKAGFADYRIQNDWKMVKGKVVGVE